MALLTHQPDDHATSLSPYMSVPETAAYLRCRRQRVDDLLSQGSLTRVKEGARTLIARSELEAYLRGADRAAGTPAGGVTLGALHHVVLAALRSRRRLLPRR